MSKYIDLWRQIAASDDYNSDDRRIIRETLYRLDDHADRVPGRTITEGDLIAAVDETNHEDMNEYQKARALLVHLGYTVPDPEPTNAESISKLLAEFTELNACCCDEQGDHDLAEFLDARGVKAGSDD